MMTTRFTATMKRFGILRLIASYGAAVVVKNVLRNEEKRCAYGAGQE